MNQKPFTMEEINTVLSLHNKGLPTNKIALIINDNKAAVANLLKSRGKVLLRHSPEKVDIFYKNLETVRSLYDSGCSLAKISGIYGVSAPLVSQNIANKRSQKETSRKYALNQEFFDDLTKESSAYFFGFLMADGCNSLSKGISWVIQSRDSYIMQSFKKEIGYGGPISVTSTQGREYHRLHIVCVDLAEKLNSLGLVPRKSKILKFPQTIPPQSMHHFVRGFFDGNGSIWISNGYPALTFLSAPEFCKGLHTELLNRGIETKFQKHKMIFQVRISNRPMIKKLFVWMYQDATLFLRRKQEKFTEAMTQLEAILSRTRAGL